jgi:hypothetical protein
MHYFSLAHINRVSAALIAIFIISYLYESFSVYVSKFRGPPPVRSPRPIFPPRTPHLSRLHPQSESSDDDSSVPLLLPGGSRASAPKHTLHRAQGALLHALHCFYSYNIMLLVMTFNVAVVVAICLGFGLGFYLHGYGSACAHKQLCH